MRPTKQRCSNFEMVCATAGSLAAALLQRLSGTHRFKVLLLLLLLFLLLTAVSSPGAPLRLGGQASAVVGIAGPLGTTNVVGGLPCLRVTTRAEAASRAGQAAAGLGVGCGGCVDELVGAGWADCRTQQQER
jgi:hypothetical protein